MATDLERMMDIWKGVLVAEFGADYRLIKVPPQPDTGDRVVIVPKKSIDRSDWYVAYVSAGRLVLDDYVPEASDGTIPDGNTLPESPTEVPYSQPL